MINQSHIRQTHWNEVESEVNEKNSQPRSIDLLSHSFAEFFSPSLSYSFGTIDWLSFTFPRSFDTILCTTHSELKPTIYPIFSYIFL